MKDYYIRCFIEGFKEGFRLPYDIVRNLLMSVPNTCYEFIQRDRPYLREPPPSSTRTDDCANFGVGMDRPAAP